MPETKPPPEPEGQAVPGADTEAERKRQSIERGVYRRRTEVDRAAETELERRRKGAKRPPAEGS